MKKIFLLLSLIPTIVLAISEQEFKEEYNAIEKKQSERNQNCDKQYKEVIQKAFKEIPSKTKDNTYEFIKDEQLALSFINKFNPLLTSNILEYPYVNLISTNCSDDISKIVIELESKRDRCSDTFDEFHFMKALIYATQNFKWSKDTNVKAKKLILEYMTTQNNETEQAILIVPMLSYDLLTLMLEQKMLDQSFQKNISDAKNKALIRHEELKIELKKDVKTKTAKNLCDYYKKHINREALISQKTRSELNAILKSISLH